MGKFIKIGDMVSNALTVISLPWWPTSKSVIECLFQETVCQLHQKRGRRLIKGEKWCSSMAHPKTSRESISVPCALTWARPSQTAQHFWDLRNRRGHDVSPSAPYLIRLMITLIATPPPTLAVGSFIYSGEKNKVVYWTALMFTHNHVSEKNTAGFRDTVK